MYLPDGASAAVRLYTGVASPKVRFVAQRRLNK